MIKAILFDFDGTIGDTFDVNLDVIKQICAEQNIKITKKIISYKNMDMRDIIRNEFKIPFYKIPKLAKEIKARIKYTNSKAAIFPGLKSVLKELSGNFKIGILSSNAGVTIKNFLKYHEIDFIQIIHSDSSLFGKDKVLNRLLKKHKLKRNEVVYIGDEGRDIEASKKIGIKNIAVTWGYNTKSLLVRHKPDFVAENPKELLKILKAGVF